MTSSSSPIRPEHAQKPTACGPRGPGLAGSGVRVLADVRPPGAWQVRPAREPSLQIRRATARAIEDSWSGLEAIGWEGVIDGAPFVVERGLEGDHRFVHGAAPAPGGASPDVSGISSDATRAVHHLSVDASVLQCAPSDPADPSWWRVVLDSVLFSVALLQGYEALHAGAVATPAGVIAITAASGGGKSTLLSELLRRGQALMADDVLVLESRGAEAPLAHPAAPLMTVPAARLPMLALNGADPPATICSLDDERWIAVPVYTEPLPLKALVILDRRPGVQSSEIQSPEVQSSGVPSSRGQSPGVQSHRLQSSGVRATLEKIEDPLAPLLGSLMNFPRSPERQRARFELASVLASTTTLWRLTADLDTPPDVLADVLLAGEL